ncbi:MAG: EthD domain-containing protein [Acidimicrobiales bacterium]
MDTQDTASYVQNVVARALTPGAEPWDAIVEECFPDAAMTDPAAFYDAVGDPERQAANARTMFESVQRFIDLSAIDVIPTSRYDGPG